MNFATLLFPGNFVPYHVVDYAINWAKENEGSLVVLFVSNRHVQPEGYPFPSDIDMAEELTTVADADRIVREVIGKEIRYIEKRAGAAHIPLKCEILYSPSVKILFSKLNRSDIIFIDKDLDDHPDLMEGLDFSIEDLREKTATTIMEIGRMDKYGDTVY
jgi:hypothetical protein